MDKPTIYTIDGIYEKIIEKYKLNYKLLQFIPTKQTIKSTESACVVTDEDTKLLPVTMTPIDDNPYHTAKTCKIKAGIAYSNILQKNKQESQQIPVENKPGLKYRIYRGYKNDDVKYFLEKKNLLINEGVTIDYYFTNFDTSRRSNYYAWFKQFSNQYGTPNASQFYTKVSNIVRSNNGRNTLWNSFPFSIEFEGFIVPDVTGYWTFGLFTDDSSFLWIGDNAVSKYTTQNALIKNGGGHAPKYIRNNIRLEKGKEYPIRIQYGEGGGGYHFDLIIKPPNSNNARYYNVLFSEISKKKSYLYYSLVKNDPQSQYYSCYINDPDNKTDNIMHSDLKVVELSVPRLSVTCDNITINSNNDIQSLGYLSMPLTFLNGHNPKYDSLFLILNSNLQQNKISLDIWELKRDSTNNKKIKSIEKIQTPLFEMDIPKDSQVNQKWLSEANRNIIDSEDKPILIILTPENFVDNFGLSNFFRQYRIKILNKIDTENPLMSIDGRFKLMIKSQLEHKPVLLYSKKACTKKDNAGVKYTDDGTRLLYKVDVNKTLNKRFYSDEKNKILNTIRIDNPLLQPNSKYINVGNFAPPGDIGTINEFNIKLDGTKTCRQLCNDSSNCDYYYTYKTGDKDMCYIGKNKNPDNILSNDMLNPENPNIMSNSSLYVKDYKIQPIKDFNFQYDNVIIKNMKKSNEYKGYSFSNNPVLESTMHPKELIDWHNSQEENLNGPPNSRTESFDPTMCTTSDCVDRIKNDKINPLTQLASSYYSNLNKSIQTNIQLDTQIKDYNNFKRDLSNNPVYQYNPADTITEKDTIYDGMNEDINELLIQENNMYILGTITTATILILAIMISTN